MNTARLWLFLVCLIWLPATLRAGIRPSFRLEPSAWDATDIVLVTGTGQPVGWPKVLEVWKGNLRVGAAINVPGLKDSMSDISRTVQTAGLFSKEEGHPPVHVTGQRFVLFLVREPGAVPDWQPATHWRDLRVATVWLEGDKTYSFVQMMNPGPSELRELEYSPAALKAATDQIIQVQVALSRIAQIADRAERARALSAYADAGFWEAHRLVLQELVECGSDALPTLRDLLRDEKLRSQRSDIVEAIGKAGGWAVGDELSQDLGAEVKFWKETAPSLQVGWWNGEGLNDWSKTETLRDHYDTTLALVRALKTMRYRGNHGAVQELRDYWNSLPQLCDKSGLLQMIEECDAMLHPAGEAAP